MTLETCLEVHQETIWVLELSTDGKCWWITRRYTEHADTNGEEKDEICISNDAMRVLIRRAKEMQEQLEANDGK